MVANVLVREMQQPEISSGASTYKRIVRATAIPIPFLALECDTIRL